MPGTRFTKTLSDPCMYTPEGFNDTIATVTLYADKILTYERYKQAAKRLKASGEAAEGHVPKSLRFGR